MVITPQYVLSGKHNLLVRNTNVDGQPHNARERHCGRNRPQELPLVRFNQFRFAQPKEDNRLPDIANAQRLIVMIEDEYFAAKLAINADCGYLNAED